MISKKKKKKKEKPYRNFNGFPEKNQVEMAHVNRQSQCQLFSLKKNKENKQKRRGLFP